MAWNGRVVMTYGRHKQRMIKSEAWISPEIKSSATTNVFSSPDTDVSIASCNGSMDASTHPTNTRQSKSRNKCNLLCSPLERVEESNKENAFSLAPETPEEEQGTRRRPLRNARMIKGRKKQEEGTPKLFSSDSEDGLRKVVGRKALTMKPDTNMWEPISRRGRGPSKDQQACKQKNKDTKKPPKKSAKPKRVKNIIENDMYTIIRSPPARSNRTSKRIKSDSERESTTSSDTSMSPFAMLESWIDTIATSTPVVELVKMDVGKKKSQDVVLLEESLSNIRSGRDGRNCTKHKQSGYCQCEDCQGAEDIAGKLFQLALLDDEDAEHKDEDGPRKSSLRTRNGKGVKGTSIKKKLSIIVISDEEEEGTGDGLRKSSLRTRNGKGGKGTSIEKKSSIREISDEEEENTEKETTGESLGLRCRRKTINSEEERCSEEIRGERRGLRCTRKNVNYKDISDDDKEGTKLGGRGKKVSQRRTRHQTEPLNHKSLECSVVLGNLSCHEMETKLKSPSVVMTVLTPEEVSPHLQGSSVVLRDLSPTDLESHSSSGRISSERGKSHGSMNCSVTLEPLSKQLQELHLSADADVCVVEEEEERSPLRSQRIMTRGQGSKEEDKCEESICPATPRKHLASFHTDSFKEVFTPRKHKDTGLTVTGREKVLQQCEQTEPISFTDCITPAMQRKCSKIGEGVYGEVFRTTNSKRQSVALKIIPIEGEFEVNEEPQKTFDEILPEIVISRELSYLSAGMVNTTHNYIGVNRVSCCKGQYPKALLAQWDRYDTRKGSENDRPDIFDDNQLFIVFEFADGGQDLENFEFDNLNQAISILQQIAGALAVAEQELEFEHRDLHWGNVLIRSTKRDRVVFRLNEEDYSVVSHGLEVSIIDFTLSRLQKDDCTVFCDLSVDPTLFEGTGDYQFDMYRKMKKENKNNWEPFHAHTNVLWLHYIIDKLLNSKTYQGSDAKGHRSLLSELRSFSRHLLSHTSAEEVVRESDLFDL